MPCEVTLVCCGLKIIGPCLKMQLLKAILIISGVVIGVIAILLQKYPSEEITAFLSAPPVSAVQKVIHGVVGLFLGSDVKKSTEGANEKSERPRPKERLFTVEELKQYDGQPGSKGLYLAILGLVYNVKKGKKHYGPGGGYEFFAGRDASRAFVSGDFTEEGLTDDITGLSSTDYIGLDEWVKFYQSDYKYVGKLIGRYYDQGGEPTAYKTQALNWITEAYQEKEADNKEKKIFPPCNSEWSAESGSRVWCTPRSGGVDRDWAGVPRKLYTPGQGKARCACVKNFGAPSHDPERQAHDDTGDLTNPNLEEYEGCQPEETSCYLTEK